MTLRQLLLGMDPGDTVLFKDAGRTSVLADKVDHLRLDLREVDEGHDWWWVGRPMDFRFGQPCTWFCLRKGFAPQ